MPFTPYTPNQNNTPSTPTGFTPFNKNSNDVSSVIDMHNTAQAQPQSLYGKVSSTLGNFSQGVAKGALGTIKGLGQVGEAAMNTILPKSLEDHTYDEQSLQTDKENGGFMGKLFNKDNLEANGPAETVGKAAEQVGEFFIPAEQVNAVEKILSSGAAEKTFAKLLPILGEKGAGIISKAAELGTKMAVRATEGGGVIGLQTGGDKSAVETGAVTGALVPPVGEALSGLVNKVGGLKEVGKRLAGALAGRGTAVIDEILKNPQAAMEGLTGESMDTLSKDARLVKEASLGMKAAAGKEYNRVLNNLQSIYENEGKSFDKGTEINKITDTLEQKFGIVKAGKIAEQTGEPVEDAGKLDYNSSRFLPKDETIINRAMNILKSFRDPLNPKTLEGLASKIDKLKSQSPSAIEVNSAIHTITSSLRESVAKMGEESGYKEGADLARNYAQSMDKLDNFNSLFRSSSEDLRPDAGTEAVKTGEAVPKEPVILPETEKTKIIQDLSTLFSGNKDVDKDTLRTIFGGQELLSREAGRTLATAPEKAVNGISDWVRQLVISPVLSPKAVGTIVAKTGLSAEKASSFITALKTLKPAARASLIELVGKNNQSNE